MHLCHTGANRNPNRRRIAGPCGARPLMCGHAPARRHHQMTNTRRRPEFINLWRRLCIVTQEGQRREPAGRQPSLASAPARYQREGALVLFNTRRYSNFSNGLFHYFRAERVHKSPLLLITSRCASIISARRQPGPKAVAICLRNGARRRAHPVGAPMSRKPGAGVSWLARHSFGDTGRVVRRTLASLASTRMDGGRRPLASAAPIGTCSGLLLRLTCGLDSKALARPTRPTPCGRYMGAGRVARSADRPIWRVVARQPKRACHCACRDDAREPPCGRVCASRRALALAKPWLRCGRGPTHMCAEQVAR